jgi:hypothetical protein
MGAAKTTVAPPTRSIASSIKPRMAHYCFLALQCKRTALWVDGRAAAALLLQSRRASEVFHVDINPSARRDRIGVTNKPPATRPSLTFKPMAARRVVPCLH